MSLTEKQIEEIAELLETGMVCYIHRITGEIESLPKTEENEFFFSADEELPWQDVLDKIEKDRDNYHIIEGMQSSEAFEVMQNFADQITDNYFRDKIYRILSNKNPFRHFKTLIDSSPYRQHWFDFKKLAYIDFVRKQVSN
ncbi:MAG: hypothetical protein GC181_15990 [Bacteroidetes bacterium]|nr:hypothetical protein [Bacteroidota bacterium]